MLSLLGLLGWLWQLKCNYNLSQIDYILVVSCLEMCKKFKFVINQLRILMPYSVIVWSCIMPRLRWWHSENAKAMETVEVQ